MPETIETPETATAPKEAEPTPEQLAKAKAEQEAAARAEAQRVADEKIAAEAAALKLNIGKTYKAKDAKDKAVKKVVAYEGAIRWGDGQFYHTYRIETRGGGRYAHIAKANVFLATHDPV